MCKTIEDMRNESLQEGIREGMREGMKQGMEQGMKKGMEEGRKDVAFRMLKAGKYTLGEIVAISGFSFEKVKELQVNHQGNDFYVT